VPDPLPIVLDGGAGEGGGQILRTALSLSAITGKPFSIVRVRASRLKPGLRPQHREAARAVAELVDA
jgi:RNA 3'-terminal phosphate cyclase (ATP)